MYRATKDIILPTTITGSLPRPSWYTENLGTRHFLEAMVTRKFREQYEDALACYIRDQEIAPLKGRRVRPKDPPALNQPRGERCPARSSGCSTR